MVTSLNSSNSYTECKALLIAPPSKQALAHALIGMFCEHYETPGCIEIVGKGRRYVLSHSALILSMKEHYTQRIEHFKLRKNVS